MNRTIRLLDGLIEGGLILLLLAAPLPYGGAVPWAQAAIEGGAGFLVALWCIRSLAAGAVTVRLTPLLWPGVAFVAIVTVQLVRPGGSVSPWATWESLRLLLAYLAVLLVLGGHLVTRARIVRLVAVLVGWGVGLAGLEFANHALGARSLLWLPKGPDPGRLTGTFVNSNHQALYLSMLLFLGLGLLLRPPRAGHGRPAEEARARRLTAVALLLGAVFVIGAALVLTLSRGAFVSTAIGVLVVLALSLHGRARTSAPWALLAVVLAFVGYAGWIGLDPLLARFVAVSQEPFADLRWSIWEATLRLTGDAPVLGVGLGAFEDGFALYRPAIVSADRVVDFAHNDYLQLLAETGLVGLLGLGAALVGTVFFVLRRWVDRRDPLVRGLTIGLLGALASALAHSVTDFGLHMPANALLLVAVAALLPAVVTLRRHRAGERVDLAEWRRPLEGPARWAWAAGMLAVLAAWSLSVVPAAVAGWELRTADLAVGVARQARVVPTIGDLAAAQRVLAVAARWEPQNPRVEAALAKTSDDLARRVWTYGVSPAGRRLPAALSARVDASQPLLATAYEAYERTLRARPRAAEIHDRLGWFLASLDGVRRALRESPATRIDARLGDVLRTDESLVPRALQSVEQSVRWDPNNPWSHRSLGLFALTYVRGPEGRPRATAAFHRALALQPGLLHELVDDLAARGADDELIRESVPRQYALVVELAREFSARNRFRSAAVTFEDALSLASAPAEQVEARLAYSRALLKGGNPSSALDRAREALVASPKEPEVFAVLAEAYESTKQWDAAETSLSSAVALADGSGSAHVHAYRSRLASLLTARGQGERAIALWRQVIAARPSDAWAHLELGRLLSERNDISGAYREYKTAEAIGGESGYVYRGVARGLLRDGHLAEAASAYEVALRLEPTRPDVRTELGDLYARIGWRDRAAEQYRLVLAQHPNDEAARRGLIQLDGPHVNPGS